MPGSEPDAGELASAPLVDPDEMRRLESYAASLAYVPNDGAWCVVRVDGRAFTAATSTLNKPFDTVFAHHMEGAARLLMQELGGLLAYTQSDEISLLLPYRFDVFNRRIPKLVSVAAGLASAHMSRNMLRDGPLLGFDGRAWVGQSVEDVSSYFVWRFLDAKRNSMNSACYWALRQVRGATAREANSIMVSMKMEAKLRLLASMGVDTEAISPWQRYGMGIFWEKYTKDGFDPQAGELTTVERRQLRRRMLANSWIDWKSFVASEVIESIGGEIGQSPDSTP